MDSKEKHITTQDSSMWQGIVKKTHDDSILQRITENGTRQPKTTQDNNKQHKTYREIQDKNIWIVQFI